jgi:hypothetical protein
VTYASSCFSALQPRWPVNLPHAACLSRPLPPSPCPAACLVGQPWSQAALDKALAALPADIGLSDTAPGGRIEYRRSLAASFTFKFFAHVALGLEQQGLSLVGVPG